MNDISNNDIVGIGDKIVLIQEVKGNAIHVINGIGEALIMDFPIGTTGVVQSIDINERVVIRIPTHRTNDYDLIGVSKLQYNIIEKNNRRDIENDYELW